MNLILKLIFFIVIILRFAKGSPVNHTNVALTGSVVSPYEDLDFIKLVKQNGYTAEEYEIRSSDGYNLILHRISGTPSHPKAAGKKVVYVQHGLWMSTDNFVCRGPKKDFVFLLADAGYDIWLGNARGNVYSRSHVSISPENNTFWDFSYKEIGIYDVKAFIDYVLKITEQEKLVYIGYSMGTTDGFVLLSSLPEYNEKVSLFISLGTVATWKHNHRIDVKLISWLFGIMEKFNSILGIQELLPRMRFLGPLGVNVCSSENTIKQLLCKTLYKFLIPSIDLSRADQVAFPYYSKTFPAGTSARTTFHLGQNMRSGEFQAYNFGNKINKQIYGSKIPPKYPLDKIVAPVAIYYGLKDAFAVKEDLDEFQKALPNVVLYEQIAHKEFTHFDVLFAKDAINLLYEPLVELVSKYT